ncbi:hypothetical protein BH11PSE11_BH11PSE11_02330 [soil metagenome]
MNRSAALYSKLALAEVWRLISLIDRNPHSPTRGSLSRTHWAWKFEDFPFPRMQEGVYALCRLYHLEDPDNPLFHSEDAGKWIEWGFEYWLTRQHRNGSFDEAYPNEQCLAATAFTTFYLGSAYRLHKEHLPAALRERLEESFKSAGEWLCRNDETHGLLSNHLAVAVAGLAVMQQICLRPDFGKRAQFFLDRIFAHQSSEGWMQEYDGADIGYGTHGFFYLAVYWQITGCRQTLDALSRFAEFLRYFVHPDGTIGGEYSSRNTEFFYPAGFEILSAHCPHSQAIAAWMRGAMTEKRPCGLWAMDAFNFMPLLNNMLFCCDAARELPSPSSLPWQEAPFARIYEKAGLWVINTEHYYAVIGLSKGGTVSVFDKARQVLAARHSGYFVHWRGKTYASQDFTLEPEIRWSADRSSAELSAPWKVVNHTVFTPMLFLAFRVFTLTLGRFPAVSRWVKNLLVKVLIRRKQRPPIRHGRKIIVGDRGIQIVDEISLPPGIAEITSAAQFTAIHMGSSMYPDVRALCGSTQALNVPVKEGKTVRMETMLSLQGVAWKDSEA